MILRYECSIKWTLTYIHSHKKGCHVCDGVLSCCAVCDDSSMLFLGCIMFSCVRVWLLFCSTSRRTRTNTSRARPRRSSRCRWRANTPPPPPRLMRPTSPTRLNKRDPLQQYVLYTSQKFKATVTFTMLICFSFNLRPL